MPRSGPLPTPPTPSPFTRSSPERTFPVGPASAKKLAYDPQESDALPVSATESFCGVGNPLGLGELLPGQTVLDLGSGPGLDSLLAARRMGPVEKEYLGPTKGERKS